MIYSILFVQFTCLTVFSHNLSPGPLSSGALYFILRAFLHPIIICFSQQIPYHRSLFCCYTNVMSSIPNLSVSSLLGNITWSNMLNRTERHRSALISALIVTVCLLCFRSTRTDCTFVECLIVASSRQKN